MKPGTRSLLAGVGIPFFTLCFSADAQWTRWEISSGGNGHWYKAVARSGISWVQASELAHVECGYLATITSSNENYFIFSLVNSSQFYGAFNGSGPALGGFQIPGSVEPAGGWAWVTGEEWSYTHWGPGLPDGGEGEDRLHYFSGVGSTPSSNWNDIHHDDSNLGGYVVERETDPQFPCLSIYHAVELCWNTLTNRTYQVQWTDTLATSNWYNYGVPIVATNSQTCVLDSTRGPERRYFRIQLLP